MNVNIYIVLPLKGELLSRMEHVLEHVQLTLQR